MIIILGLILPYVTKIYVAVMMPMQLFQFTKNKEKIGRLKNVRFYQNFPNRNRQHKCIYCRQCNDPRCFCLFCGFVATKEEITTTNEYHKQIRKIENNLGELDRLNRIIVSAVEDTYMPVIQAYMVIPLICQNIYDINNNDTASITDDIISVTLSYSKLTLTILSIATSIVSLSISITHLHFERTKKKYLGSRPGSKYLFLLAMACQITSRLITFIVFGLVVHSDYAFAPVWLVLSCIGHIAVVFITKLLLLACQRQLFKPRIINSLFCSIGSVYTYVKGDFAVKEIERRISEKSDTQKESEHSKMIERFIFAAIVFIEQILMYVGIGLEPLKPFDLNITTFFVVNSLLLIVGLMAEWIVYLLLNPTAKYRVLFKSKKNMLMILIGLFVIALVTGLVYLTYYYGEGWYIPIVSITTILVLFFALFMAGTHGIETRYSENTNLI